MLTLAKKYSWLFILVVAMELVSCAQRATLTGGPKDVTPPKIIRSQPENATLNFNATEVIVEFDKFVRLNNIQNQLIVSPLMDEPPIATVKGKKLHIKLAGKLAEKTTYSINFGDAIVDITEANSYPNYKYVFSTGNIIDTLSYSGRVINSFNLTPVENVFVMLYRQLDDSVPLTLKPAYLSKTKKEGNFTLTNIAPGNYKVFALEDVNGNYLYDLPNEQLAFLSHPILLDSTSTSDSLLYLFAKVGTTQFVKKIENKHYGELSVETNLPSEHLELFTKKNELIELSATETNLTKTQHTFWLKNNITESEQTFIIKDNGITIDTSNVAMITKKDNKDSLLIIKHNLASLFDLNKAIEITANQPLEEIHKENMELLEDSVPVYFEVKKDSLSSQKIKLIYLFKENTSYQLKIKKEALSSIYKLKNDTLTNTFKTKKLENYGNLTLTVVPNFGENYIVQLMQNNEVVKKFYKKNNYTFNINYLKPGDYQIKLIIDNNSNKKWDTGNYQTNTQPERVVIYNEKITIRENWDNEIKWEVKF